MYKNINKHREIGLFTINPGLNNITKFLKHIDSPHSKVDYIIVGGTNGKGTVSNTISKILEVNGYKVGLYTSPHLISVTERIKINSEEINLIELDKILGFIFNTSKEIDIALTYFELLTVAAFIYFKQEEIDIGVLEVGMGGRWDATNVINPLVSIITNVTLEHTTHLGDTIEKIASEKAEIIKDYGAVITSAKSEALNVISKAAERKSAKIFKINENFSFEVLNDLKFNYKGSNLALNDLEFGIKGYQYINNAVLAVYCIEYLMYSFNYKIDIDKLIFALKNTKISARMEYIDTDLPIILDGAHNEDASLKLADTLCRVYSEKKFNFLISLLKNKDIEGFINNIVPIANKIIITELKNPDSHSSEEIEKVISKSFNNYKIIGDPIEAYKVLVDLNEPSCVTGSLYLIGFLKDNILNEKSSTRL